MGESLNLWGGGDKPLGELVEGMGVAGKAPEGRASGVPQRSSTVGARKKVDSRNAIFDRGKRGRFRKQKNRAARRTMEKRAIDGEKNDTGRGENRADVGGTIKV